MRDFRKITFSDNVPCPVMSWGSKAQLGNVKECEFSASVWFHKVSFYEMSLLDYSLCSYLFQESLLLVARLQATQRGDSFHRLKQGSAVCAPGSLALLKGRIQESG